MLLRIGELTTPILNVQSGVARLWPLLRYLHAVADTPGFRLVKEWKDVDAHQKGVASDDLGVGLGMEVLYEAFGYTGCVDGRAFLHRAAQLGLLAADNKAPPKVGSMKMADYAAIDAAGKVHLVECKGTQDSAYSLHKAMSEGQEQKRSVVCSSRGAEKRLIGQRLVVGAQIRLQNTRSDTRVIITDPAPENAPAVVEHRVASAAFVEPVFRMEVARALGAAGAVRTSAALGQTDRPATSPSLEGSSQRDRIQTALRSDEPELETFQAFGGVWIGERALVPLFAPLLIADKVYRYARLTTGAGKELLAELRESGPPTRLFQEQYPDAAGRLQNERVVSGEDNAAIVRDGVSISAIELLERRL